MIIEESELAQLLAKLTEALKEDETERLRVSLWCLLDQRRTALNPPADRRSVRAREHATQDSGTTS
jgi:hypothetical protein